MYVRAYVVCVRVLVHTCVCLLVVACACVCLCVIVCAYTCMLEYSSLCSEFVTL